MKPLIRFLLGLLVLLGLGSAQAASTITSQSDGRTCITSSGNGLPGIGISLSVPLCTTGSPLQKFEFTAGGAIVSSSGKCLVVPAGGGKAGDQPTLADCGDTDRQSWRYEADLLKSTKYGWCLAVGSGLPNPKLTLANCAYNANQKWTIDGGVASNWPQAASSTKPSAVVSGSSLTFTQMLNTIAWIQDETTLSNTPFCWKKPGYDRGAGHAPNECSGDKIGAICYDQCPSGYGRLSGADPTCGGGCDPDFHPTALRTCQRDYTTANYRMGDCPKHYDTYALTCTKRIAPFNTISRSKSCPGGFYGTGTFCARDAATRSRPIKEASYRIQTCHAGETTDAGLCYPYARTGYTCTATICTQQCASGSTPCGAGCAQNAGTCTASIVDMVVSPAIMLASLATEGAAGAAANSVRAAVKTAKQAAELGQTAAQLADILKNSIESYMAAAENNLAAISTANVAAAVAAKYTQGSANYRQIAREYAVLQIIAAVSDMFAQLDILAITTADVTGISGTVAAFAKPPCEQHKSIP